MDIFVDTEEFLKLHNISHLNQTIANLNDIIVSSLNELFLLDRPNAVIYLEKAHLYSPNNSIILNNLGYVYQHQINNLEKSLYYYKKCVQIDKKSEAAFLGLLDVLTKLRQTDEHWEYTDIAVANIPTSGKLLYIKGLNEFEKCTSTLTEIINIFKKSLNYLDQKEKCQLMLNLGYMYGRVGLYKESCKYYMDSIVLDPTEIKSYHNTLFSLNYEYDQTVVKQICSQFNTNSVEELSKKFDNAIKLPKVDLPKVDHTNIVIGFVGGDFSNHAVSKFTKFLYRDAFLYSTTFYPEAPGKNYKYISELDTKSLANEIIKDKVNILIDLAGYTSGNRLDVFSYLKDNGSNIRLLSYIGYPVSSSIMPRISDEYTEMYNDNKDSVLKMPGLFLCYKHDINILIKKVNTTGPIVYGSLAKLSKINQYVIDIWSKILEQRTDSKLIIKSNYFRIKDVKDSFIEQFKPHCRHQLVLLFATQTSDEHLDICNQFDLQLDTFPYSGTTVTCESLYMGVPVLTLNPPKGCDGPDLSKHISRVSGSILNHVGLQEYIATSVDDYIFKAVNFTKRNSVEIHKKFINSMDSDKLTTNFDNLIKQFQLNA